MHTDRPDENLVEGEGPATGAEAPEETAAARPAIRAALGLDTSAAPSARNPDSKGRRSMRHHIRVACVFAVLTSLLGFAALVRQPDTANGALPAPTFTWSMDKLFGPDRNGDGLVNDPRNSFGAAHPSTFTVRLDACTVGNAATITYAWTINGTVTERPTPLCTLTKELGRGSHTITLRLTGGRSVTKTILVRDLVIVSIGDSAGAGEGAPDVPASHLGPARWQNERCHRSSKAAPAVAAKVIEDLDPHTSVTFIHLACSGAAITDRNANNSKAEGGLLEPYAGLKPPAGAAPLDPQFDQVRAILGQRPIDALLIQIGANDLEFGTVVESCMRQARCDLPSDSAALDPALQTIVQTGLTACGALPYATGECGAFVTALGNGPSGGKSAASLFESKIAPLRAKFAVLRARISLPRTGGGLGVAATHVFLNQYHDPTRGDDGNACNPTANGLNPLRTLLGFNLQEAAFATVGIVPTLNTEVRNAATLAGWTMVAGIPGAFRTHGYCSSSRWVDRLEDSFVLQRDHNGVLHPNATGYQKMSAQMFAAMRPVLGL